MKLYTQIENENGKHEGMGGNEHLMIDVSVGNEWMTQLHLSHVDETPDGKPGWLLKTSDGFEVSWINDDKER